MRRKLSLRLRLAVLVAGTTLPLIVFSAAIVGLNYEASRRSASARILELTRGSALAVDRELQSMTAALRVLALSQLLERGDLDGFRQQAASFVGQFGEGANILLLEPSGRPLLDMAVPAGAPLPERAKRPGLGPVLETGRPSVTDLFVGGEPERPLIAIDVPVWRGGSIVQVLSFIPPMELFGDIIRQQRLEPDWVMSIFDRAGVNVARMPNHDRFVGTRASDSLHAPLLAQQDGVVETVSLEGIPLLTAFSRALGSGWSVAVGVPRSALTIPLWRSLAITVSLGLVFLLLGLAFAVRMAARIASAETHRELLINELNHRVKNTLATVQSIVVRTLRSAANNTDARHALEARLIALSRVHNVLTEMNWESADLHRLVSQVLEPYRAVPGRIGISGPNLKLRPRAALSIAMVLHELATNATKYGALSNATGRVVIEWLIEPRPDGETLRIDWDESGGPPVAVPERKGFGSVLIERSITQELGGEAELAFHPSGLSCTIRIPAHLRGEPAAVADDSDLLH